MWYWFPVWLLALLGALGLLATIASAVAGRTDTKTARRLAGVAVAFAACELLIGVACTAVGLHADLDAAGARGLMPRDSARIRREGLEGAALELGVTAVFGLPILFLNRRRVRA